MSDVFRITSFDVVRRGLFRWDVVTRVSGGIDMCLNQPYLFRWMAVRSARRQASEAAQPSEHVVARFEIGRPS